MNIEEKILNLNRQAGNNENDIHELLLTIITKFQLFEPCKYLSEDEEWLDITIISMEDTSISQPLTIRKSEITTFGIFNREEMDVNLNPQQGSEDLYQ